jgi:hypothetical protein
MKQRYPQVRLHVKVDPEETDNWIIPAKGKTNDLFFYGDEELIPPRRTAAIKRVETEELGGIDNESASAGYGESCIASAIISYLTRLN